MSELANSNYIDHVIYMRGPTNYYTLRWTFNTTCRVGTFIDGSPWVAPLSGSSVTLTGCSLLNYNGGALPGHIQPASNSAGDKVNGGLKQGGLMVNPIMTGGAGALGASNGGRVGLHPADTGRYNSALDVMLSIDPINSSGYVTYSADTSLVRSIDRLTQPSGWQGSCPAYTEAYSCLTVLMSAPSDGGSNTFRPPFSGTTKRQFTLSDFDFSDFSSGISDVETVLAAGGCRLASSADAAEIKRKFANVYPDLYCTRYTADNADTARGVAPYSAGTSSDYGLVWGNEFAAAMFGILGQNYSGGGSISVDDRKTALHGMLQRGIDIYYSYLNGTVFNAGAAQGSGRYLPLVLFGSLCTDTTVKANVLAVKTTYDTIFHETDQIKCVPHDLGGGNIPVWGDKTYGILSDYTSWNKYYWQGNYRGMFWNNSIGPTCTSTPYEGSDNLKNLGDPHGWIDGPSAKPGTEYCQTSGAGIVEISLLFQLLPNLLKTSGNDELMDFVKVRWTYDKPVVIPDIAAAPSTSEYYTDTFSGSGSAGQTMTLTARSGSYDSNAPERHILVTVGGVVKQPTTDYTFNNSTRVLTSVTAFASGTNNVVVKEFMASPYNGTDLQFYTSTWGPTSGSASTPVRVSSGMDTTNGVGRFANSASNNVLGESTAARKTGPNETFISGMPFGGSMSAQASVYVQAKTASFLTAKADARPIATNAYVAIPAAQLTTANAVFKALDLRDSGGANTFKRHANSSAYYVAIIPCTSRMTATALNALLNDQLMLDAVCLREYTNRSLGSKPSTANINALSATFVGGTSWCGTTGSFEAFLTAHSLTLD